MNKISKGFSNLSNTKVLFIVLGIAFITSIISISIVRTCFKPVEWWSSALQNFSTEMLGAFVTFVLIDKVIGGRENGRQKISKKLEDCNVD